MIAYEEKATLPGRQCGINQKQNYITRLSAGGQRLSDTEMIEFSPDISGTAAMAQLGGTAMQHTPEISRSFDRYPDIGYHSLSASLAFLRWRRLISPMAAVIRKPAVLSPLFFTDSISSNTSCGTRTFTCFDLLFTEPVAITDSPRVWCYSLYAKKNHIQYLTCYAPSNKVNSTLIKPRHKNGNASECGNTTEASNHNVRWSNIMACIQHTQTRPEFTWRFLSASERYPTAKPLVIYVNASSEQEARDTMPGVNLVFAARLPYHAFQVLEVRHD